MGVKSLTDKNQNQKFISGSLLAIALSLIVHFIVKGSGGRNEEEDIAAYLVKIEKLRQDLAEKSRRVGTLERQLDDVPSRYELDQYQRRFFELVTVKIKRKA